VRGYGLRVGAADLRSAGPIAFGPEGILFLADNILAKVFAVDVADTSYEVRSAPFNKGDVDLRVSRHLGCDPDDVHLQDVAVHPRSQNVYLSVHLGHGDAGQPAFVRIDHLDSAIADVPLENVAVAEASMTYDQVGGDNRLDPMRRCGPGGTEIPSNERHLSSSMITRMRYVDGARLVVGTANTELSPSLRRIPFPFRDGDSAAVKQSPLADALWQQALVKIFSSCDDALDYEVRPITGSSSADSALRTGTVGCIVAELGATTEVLDKISFVQSAEGNAFVAHTAFGPVEVVSHDARELCGISRVVTLNRSYVLALQVGDHGRQHLRSLRTRSSTGA